MNGLGWLFVFLYGAYLVWWIRDSEWRKLWSRMFFKSYRRKRYR